MSAALRGPAPILRKANSYLLERLKDRESCESPRQFTDAEIHDMVQDILDAGGARASSLEDRTWMDYWGLARDIRAARKTIRLRLVISRL